MFWRSRTLDGAPGDCRRTASDTANKRGRRGGKNRSCDNSRYRPGQKAVRGIPEMHFIGVQPGPFGTQATR